MGEGMRKREGERERESVRGEERRGSSERVRMVLEDLIAPP